MNGMNNENTRSLFSGMRSAEAIRSTGYKSTAHALGELVDNSIQAHASLVKIVVEVEQTLRVERTRQSIVRVSVIDNGSGMSEDELYNAVLFGQGTHFEEKGGLGKFGVGLPQASLSQGKKLKVWSWQTGRSNSHSVGYDLDDENWRKSGYMVQPASTEQIPHNLEKYIDTSVQSGTIVQWSKLDKISWVSAPTLYEHSEFIIGRMYRNWINDNKVRIEYITADFEDGEQLGCRVFKAVDPLYVMTNTSDEELNPPVYPMFIEIPAQSMPISYKGVSTQITIRTSVAKPEILKLVNKHDAAGAKPWGKHAKKNIGLSVVREGRELELDPKWNGNTSNSRDSRERWWGAEINFGRELDALFGVTNDKQSATRLSGVVFQTFEDHCLEGERISDAKKRLEEEEPELFIMLEIGERIRALIKNVMKKIPKEESPKKPEEDDLITEVETSTSTTIDETVKHGGPQGESTVKKFDNLEDAKKEVKEGLTNFGVSPVEVDKIVKSMVTTDYKVFISKLELPGDDAFFTVRTDGGKLIILLNTAHVMYDELFSCFEYIEDDKEYDQADANRKLRETYRALKYMLISWARLEDIAILDGKTGLSRIRSDWGRQCRMLKNNTLSEDDDY